MTILTNEELERQKKEARKREIRQNVKSHCTKIRDGILKNGSTSGNRAIWELFQNAGDLADCADIRIVISENAFMFSHKGTPFTYDSLCSLVKQVSSEEKEGDDTVGRYGTGFLTTHKFSRKITINGSMQISEDPIAYVDVNSFVINRENFDDIPAFIDDMTTQIEAVESLMDKEQKSEPTEWTELWYELNPERLEIAKTAIDEAIRLMPYVLTFNDNIGSCTIIDKTRNFTQTFKKVDKETSIDGLLCKCIFITKDACEPYPFNCYYLELHDGESRIILPLKTETDVCTFKNVPRLFVHFPLIGLDYFGVNFLYHSHRFTPEEPRDNIIVPKDNDATYKIAEANKVVLDEMTNYLWTYLEKHIIKWTNTINMASLNIKDKGYAEAKTEAFYKGLKEAWVAEFSKLNLIEIDGVRYSMNDEKHPVVFEPSLETFLSEDTEHNYLSTLYAYAKNAVLIPAEDEALRWSQIVAGWNPEKSENFVTLETIVEYVSSNQGDSLLDMLKIIVAANHAEYFEKYALLPNRENILKVRDDLRDAASITNDLYGFVKALDASICDKFVKQEFADIIKLTLYTRQSLREELNSVVTNMENECWKNSTSPHPYEGDFEKALIILCSCFTTPNGDSKRNKLMPIICRFEGIEYVERHIPARMDDSSNVDLFRQIFTSLVENQMKKIDQYDEKWVKANMDDLVRFVDVARGDDYKNFCVRYAIYPDMNSKLHLPEDLKKNANVNEKLFELYSDVLGEDLKSKCVDDRFSTFCEKYTEESFQYTPKSVAKEIQNKLSAENYQDTVLLDIIDLTESETSEGLQWRILFKDIYDQRESIRYKLGTDDERNAINRMMKKKSPDLLKLMADVSERTDASNVIYALNQTISDMEHEAHIKMLGNFVELHIQEYLTDALNGSGIDVRNEQGGQDLILSKEGFNDYYIEIKSRWVDKVSAIMSYTQFHNAVDNPDRYSLISVQMWTFDQKRVENDEHVELSEMEPRIRVCNNIGRLESNLLEKVENAFYYDENEISAYGSYEVHVPQKIFDKSYDDLLEVIRRHFGS